MGTKLGAIALFFIFIMEIDIPPVFGEKIITEHSPNVLRTYKKCNDAMSPTHGGKITRDVGWFGLETNYCLTKVDRI